MRKNVDKILCEIETNAVEFASRNPLEQPWSLTEDQLVRRAGRDALKAYKSAREETMSLTEEAVRVEGEIDEMVRSLYGV